MAKAEVLIELESDSLDYDECMEAFVCDKTRHALSERLSKDMSGVGFEFSAAVPPVPLFSDNDAPTRAAFTASSAIETRNMPKRGTYVLTASIDREQLDKVQRKRHVEKVWPCSPMVLLGEMGANSANVEPHFPGINPHFPGINPHMPGIGMHYPGINPHYPGVNPHFPGINPHGVSEMFADGSIDPALLPTLFDLASSSGNSTDCRPFRPGASVETIRALLGTNRLWFEGFQGQNVVIGILDEGVNGDVYPVIGGFNRPNSPPPGSASIQSHGSMCAADVLVAAPQAKIMDYPFLGVPNSGGALAMFHAVLDQRRKDGTPHLTTNSYGFVGIPTDPDHEVNNPNHVLHKKVREVVRSGAPCFFSAGNCGGPCASGDCLTNGIGTGKSIHASNCLDEVITVGAVNSRRERIGYSSQGPGHNHADGFAKCKPDISAYSHFFGNFGPGRPAGTSTQPFDSGTSAACPVAAGVGALLLSMFGELTPEQLKGIMCQTATNIGKPGFDFETGYGVINAAVAHHRLLWSADFSEFEFAPPIC